MIYNQFLNINISYTKYEIEQRNLFKSHKVFKIAYYSILKKDIGKSCNITVDCQKLLKVNYILIEKCLQLEIFNRSMINI